MCNLAHECVPPPPSAATAPPNSTPQTSCGGAKIFGRVGADTRFACCASNFSRDVLRTFFQVSQPPDSRTRPTLAFPRSSAATHHLPPIPRRETLRPWGWGKGEWEKRGTASVSKEVPAEAWTPAAPGGPWGRGRRREEGWNRAGKGREESKGAAGVATLTLRSQWPRAAAGSP